MRLEKQVQHSMMTAAITYIRGFVGFAPADSPSIAISVVLEGGYSGSGAQYVAKAVFDAYFNE